jgi:hypothetical protein
MAGNGCGPWATAWGAPKQDVQEPKPRFGGMLSARILGLRSYFEPTPYGQHKLQQPCRLRA